MGFFSRGKPAILEIFHDIKERGRSDEEEIFTGVLELAPGILDIGTALAGLWAAGGRNRAEFCDRVSFGADQQLVQ